MAVVDDTLNFGWVGDGTSPAQKAAQQAIQDTNYTPPARNGGFVGLYDAPPATPPPSAGSSQYDGMSPAAASDMQSAPYYTPPANPLRPYAASDTTGNGLNDVTGWADGVVKDSSSPSGFSYQGKPTYSNGGLFVTPPASNGGFDGLYSTPAPSAADALSAQQPGTNGWAGILDQPVEQVPYNYPMNGGFVGAYNAPSAPYDPYSTVGIDAYNAQSRGTVGGASLGYSGNPYMNTFAGLASMDTLGGLASIAGQAMQAPVDLATGPMAAQVSRDVRNRDIGGLAADAIPGFGPLILGARTASNYDQNKQEYANFQNNPDVNPYFKTATSTVLNPLSYLGGGLAAPINLGLNEANTALTENGSDIPGWDRLSPGQQQALILAGSVVLMKVGEKIVPKLVEAAPGVARGAADAFTGEGALAGERGSIKLPGGNSDMPNPDERANLANQLRQAGATDQELVDAGLIDKPPSDPKFGKPAPTPKTPVQPDTFQRVNEGGTADESLASLDARRAALNFAAQENQLRLGANTAAQEIHDFRVKQVANYRQTFKDALANGATPGEAAKIARATGTGSARETFANPIPKEQFPIMQQIAAKAYLDGNLSDFEHWQIGGALEDLESGAKSGLQPAEIPKWRALFGDEITEMVIKSKPLGAMDIDATGMGTTPTLPGFEQSGGAIGQPPMIGANRSHGEPTGMSTPETVTPEQAAARDAATATTQASMPPMDAQTQAAYNAWGAASQKAQQLESQMTDWKGGLDESKRAEAVGARYEATRLRAKYDEISGQGSQPSLLGSGTRNPAAPDLGLTSQFPEDTSTPGKSLLQHVEDASDYVSGTARTATTAGHVGIVGLHGYMTAINDPVAWARGVHAIGSAVMSPEELAVQRQTLASDLESIAAGSVEKLKKGGSKAFGPDSGDVPSTRNTLFQKIPGLKQIAERNEAGYDAGTESWRGSKIRQLLQKTVDDNVSKGMPATITQKQANAIASYSNHFTMTIGGSSNPVLGALLWTPRMMMAQAAILRDPLRGGVVGSVARRDLARTSATAFGGIMAANVAVSMAKGKDKSNFDLWGPGLGHDIPRDKSEAIKLLRSPMMFRVPLGLQKLSTFGPFDSSMRLGMNELADIISKDPNAAKQDFQRYFINHIAPLPGILADVWSGKNWSGGPVTWKTILQDHFTPMSAQQGYDIGTAVADKNYPDAAASALQLGLGVKGSPLSAAQQYDMAYQKAHGGQSYYDASTLDQAKWQKDNPKPASTSDVGVAAAGFHATAAAKQDQLQQNMTAPGSTMSVGEYNKVRQQNATYEQGQLSTLPTGSIPPKVNDALNSYFDMFAKTEMPDGSIDYEKLATLEAQWNKDYPTGQDDLQQYGLIQHSDPVETARRTAMNQLTNDGYFDPTSRYGKKYINMASGLSQDKIDQYVSMVAGSTKTYPGLDHEERIPLVLREAGVTDPRVTWDVINASKADYQNPLRALYKEGHPGLMDWFNPSARWSDIKATNKLP